MKYQNQIPYFSKDLAAERNVWGEVLQVPDGFGPDAFSPFSHTDNTGMELKKTLEKMEDFYDINKENISAFVTNFELKIPSRTIPNIIKAPEATSYRLTPHEFGMYQQLRAGIDPESGEALKLKGIAKDSYQAIMEENLMVGRSLKDQFYDVMEKYNMFNTDLKDLDPKTYKAVVSELSIRLSIMKEVADLQIVEYGDVKENMLRENEQARSISDRNTLRGVNDVLK